jgi:hypothetical protein
MEQEEIKALLDRFFRGETSEEEEAKLREHLFDPAFRDLFQAEKDYLSVNPSAVPEPSDDFFKNLEAVTRTEKKIYRLSPALRYGISVAAGAALLIGSYLILDKMQSRGWTDTYDDPELAMAEVRSILTMVSGNMKAGTEALGSMRSLSIAPSAMKDIGRLNDAIDNNLLRLRYLNNLENAPKTTGNDN